MITKTTVITRAPKAITAELDAEQIVMGEDMRYHGLDRVGARIWDLLAEPTTITEMAIVLEGEFTVTAAQAEDDLVAFVGDLHARGLILEV